MANRARQRFASCRCSMEAQAIDRPSKVAVPRPISSRMTSERAARLVQDRRRLDHLDHEGRAPAREVVGGADAREQPVDDAEMRVAGRHEGADLGEHGDQRVLAQVGRLAAHVGAGDEEDAPPGLRRPERSQSLAMKAPPSRFSAASTTGWRPPTMRKARLVVDPGPRPAGLAASSASAAVTSTTASASAAAAIRPACSATRCGEVVEDAELDAQGAVGRRRDLRLELAELDGSRSASRRPWSGDGRRSRSRAPSRKSSPTACGTSTK